VGRPVVSEYKVKKAAKPNSGKVWYIIGRPNGRRIRAWFPSKEAAQAEATERNIAMRKLGKNAVALDAVLAETARDGATRLKPFGKTLKDAIDFYLLHLNNLRHSITATELETLTIAEFDRRLKEEEISKKHYTSMRETLRKFVTKYGDTQISTLTGAEIKAWLAGLPLVAKTRSRHFGYLNNALTIATKANALAANPLEGLEPFRVKRKTKVEILTPEEMKAFLSSLDRDWLPFFAICAFTGLRREEVSRLDWTEIKLERLLIDLPPEKGKNNRRKLEEIPANLAKILEPFVRKSGFVKPKKKLQHAMENAVAGAKIEWKQNCLRHSFCSYAVALKGLEWTSDQADHSIAILKRDYREVVTKEDAAKYFSILVTNQHLSPLLGDMTKPTRPKNSKTTSPIAKKSKSVKKVESAKSTPAEDFAKLLALHETKGPVPFRPTQRDYKRQEKLVSADSLSEIAFDDGLFKDEVDLNGFVRWILRCQAKR
jgi:integrase